MPAASREELDRARTYIGSVRWQNAKTYEAFAPHEYTVRKWNPDLDDEFVNFVELIRSAGYKEKWKKRWWTYLDVVGHRYWTMGAPIEITIIINRETQEQAKLWAENNST